MVPHSKALVFILLLLFVSSFSGCADGFKDGAKLPYPNSSVKGTGCPTQGTEPAFRTAHENIQMMARKLIGVEALLDYEKPGSNPSHTPTPDNGGKDTGENPAKEAVSTTDSSGKRSRDSSSSDITQQREVSKRTKLVNNGECNGSISFDCEHRNQAFKIEAMKVYTAEEEEEERILSTRLTLYEVEEHIIKKMNQSHTEKIYSGEGAKVTVCEYDTNMSECELTVKR
ncbi:hypothetical protein CK203_024254 [Vitis vinifera]|uniref:Lipoprotein n=1 Tax=Vitis vinifera TaxID=29760 RepID=A0A438I4N9_VITVI|nr:hypothetical protein CK203_024254 [Vitis vinifera]